MAGTPAGGRKAAATNKARHGKDFYVKRGGEGGTISRGGGFTQNHEAAVAAGRKGGLASHKNDRPRTVTCRYCPGLYVSTKSRNSHVVGKHSDRGRIDHPAPSQ